MIDVAKIHDKICPSKTKMVQLSLDGVQEAKSSLVSLDTFSINFHNCRHIYPLRIIKPFNKFRVDEQEQIAMVLKDINDNNFEIYCGVFDRIKRSVVKCILSHAAYFACEYCECPAQLITINPKDNNAQKKKKQLVWPSDTRHGKLRTLNSVRQITEQIELNGGPLERNVAKGIVGKSHFLDQPRFHYINDLPCEYMHCVCLGQVKRNVELTFKVGETRDRVTKRKLSDPALFNHYISCVQVVREFGRRCRNLDFSVYKAEEFRNLILFFFPLVIKCIEPTFTDEIKLWLNLAFMVRSCVIPNSEFRTLPDKIVYNCCETYYKLFEKLYGQKNCSYSIHVVASHLLKMRGTQPLTFRSAFKFESFFAEMKNQYVPGTKSTTKQILKNCYMKRIIEHHTCEKTIYYHPQKKPSPGKTYHPGLENNSLIYITDEDNKHDMYEIIDIDNDNKDLFICIKQGKFKFSHELTPNLNWNQVGVYKVGPTLNEEHVLIARHEISGKVLKVDNLLITCPLNVLHEK